MYLSRQNFGVENNHFKNSYTLNIAVTHTFLFPTRIIGTLGQKCLTSGVHFSGMLSRESGESMLKHISITSVSG